MAIWPPEMPPRWWPGGRECSTSPPSGGESDVSGAPNWPLLAIRGCIGRPGESSLLTLWPEMGCKSKCENAAAAPHHASETPR